MPQSKEPQTRWAWVEIDRGALRKNVRAFKRLLRGRERMCCVVKADAYGHGALPVAGKLAELGQLTQENAKIINEATKRVPKEIRMALEQSSRIALQDIEKLIADAIKSGAVEQAPTDSTAQALRDITLTYMRQGVENTVALRVDTAFTIGVYAVGQTDRLLPVVQKDYSFFASFPAGVKLGVETLKGYVGQMKYLFSKEGAKQLGGFGAIGSIFPATWDWHQFWYMTAFLSIILAFMNILPIPALDGGHVLFLIYEIVARRKPSDKFMERAQMVGMFLLFALLIWANLNDVIRFLF